MSHPVSSTFLKPGLWGACFTPCRVVSGGLGLWDAALGASVCALKS